MSVDDRACPRDMSQVVDGGGHCVGVDVDVFRCDSLNDRVGTDS